MPYISLLSTLRVEMSADGNTWPLAADDPAGGLALAAATIDPLGVSIRSRSS